MWECRYCTNPVWVRNGVCRSCRTSSGSGSSCLAALFLIAIVYSAVQAFIAFLISLIPVFIGIGVVILLIVCIRKFGFLSTLKVGGVIGAIGGIGIFGMIKNQQWKNEARAERRAAEKAQYQKVIAPFLVGLETKDAASSKQIEGIVGEHMFEEFSQYDFDDDFSDKIKKMKKEGDAEIISSTTAPKFISSYRDLSDPQYFDLGPSILMKSKLSSDDCYSYIDKMDTSHLMVMTACFDSSLDSSDTWMGAVLLNKKNEKTAVFDQEPLSSQLPKSVQGLWTSGSSCSKDSDDVLFVGAQSMMGSAGSEDIFLFSIKKTKSTSDTSFEFTALGKKYSNIVPCIGKSEKISDHQYINIECGNDDIVAFSEKHNMLPEGFEPLEKEEDDGFPKYFSQNSYKVGLCKPKSVAKKKYKKKSRKKYKKKSKKK